MATTGSRPDRLPTGYLDRRCQSRWTCRTRGIESASGYSLNRLGGIIGFEGGGEKGEEDMNAT